MKKQITKTITTGILVSFLAGTIYLLAIYGYFDAQTPNHYEDGRPKMDCFGGLQYFILIGINILIVFANLPAFLNLFKPIRENKYFSFFSFFGFYLLYLCFILSQISSFSGEEFLFFIPWVNVLVWAFYYFKFRKIMNSKPLNTNENFN